jgi:hypothetical protein
MPARRFAPSLLFVLLLIVALGAACSPAAPRSPVEQDGQRASAEVPVAAPQATSAPPVAGEAKAGAPADSAPETGATAGTVPLARAERLVIKNAEMDLLVVDTDAALDQVLGVVSDVEGYVLNMVTWQEGDAKLAKVTMRMPAERYEEALRRLRRIGEVQKESSSGEDVTDQYVDLQSQERNLEATAERLRSFLDKATTVEEALQVNAKLKEIEAEIEQVKGRLSYLSDRAAYSTISVYLHPQRPTPTPTYTPTPTPTPTVMVWNPGRTAAQAGGVLAGIVKGLVEAGIWLGIVAGGPERSGWNPLEAPTALHGSRPPAGSGAHLPAAAAALAGLPALKHLLEPAGGLRTRRPPPYDLATTIKSLLAWGSKGSPQ